MIMLISVNSILVSFDMDIALYKKILFFTPKSIQENSPTQIKRFYYPTCYIQSNEIVFDYLDKL